MVENDFIKHYGNFFNFFCKSDPKNQKRRKFSIFLRSTYYKNIKSHEISASHMTIFEKLTAEIVRAWRNPA